jgi:hypothetical protein
MPELSQRTLGKIIPILTDMPLSSGVDSYSEQQSFWRTKPFEHGFPQWLVDFFLDSGMDWSKVIPALHGGKVLNRAFVEVRESLRHQILGQLTAFAFEESDT